MEYLKIFTTAGLTHNVSQTHTHSLPHVFSLAFFLSHAHTSKTHTYGRWWCSGCFGPWQRRHSNHWAITSPPGKREEKTPNRQSAFVTLGSICFFFFTSPHTALQEEVWWQGVCIFTLCRITFLIISVADWNTHTHTPDSVISQATRCTALVTV